MHVEISRNVETFFHIVQQKVQHSISYLAKGQPRSVISDHLDVVPNFARQSRTRELFHLEPKMKVTYSMRELWFIEKSQVMELSEPNMWNSSNPSFQVQFKTVISIPSMPDYSTPTKKSFLHSGQLVHKTLVTGMMMVTSKWMVRRKTQAVTLPKTVNTLISLSSNLITVIMMITKQLHRRNWHILHLNEVNTVLHQTQVTPWKTVKNSTVPVCQDKAYDYKLK